jgi:hypothetical protein
VVALAAVAQPGATSGKRSAGLLVVAGTACPCCRAAPPPPAPPVAGTAAPSTGHRVQVGHDSREEKISGEVLPTMIPGDDEDPIVLHEIVDAALSVEDHQMLRDSGRMVPDLLAEYQTPDE